MINESDLKRCFATFSGKFRKFIRLILGQLQKNKVFINKNFTFYTELINKYSQKNMRVLQVLIIISEEGKFNFKIL